MGSLILRVDLWNILLSYVLLSKFKQHGKRALLFVKAFHLFSGSCFLLLIGSCDLVFVSFLRNVPASLVDHIGLQQKLFFRRTVELIVEEENA